MTISGKQIADDNKYEKLKRCKTLFTIVVFPLKQMPHLVKIKFRIELLKVS